MDRASVIESLLEHARRFVWRGDRLVCVHCGYSHHEESPDGDLKVRSGDHKCEEAK
jgi:hypothetical protein